MCPPPRRGVVRAGHGVAGGGGPPGAQGGMDSLSVVHQQQLERGQIVGSVGHVVVHVVDDDR